MHQRGRLFVLMVTELPTVMNSRDDAPRAASIAHSHRRWMEIGPGGEAKEVHTCLRLLWTHMDAGISAHAHTERESEGECVCVCWGVGVLTSMDAYCSLGRRWSSYGWQYGAYRGGDLLGGLFCVGAEKLLDVCHLPSCPQLVLSAVGDKPHAHTISDLAAALPLLLHYHMDGCHIAIYCMAMVGKSVKVFGLNMVS